MNFKFRKSFYAENFYDGILCEKSLYFVVKYLFHKGTAVSLKILQEILTKLMFLCVSALNRCYNWLENMGRKSYFPDVNNRLLINFVNLFIGEHIHGYDIVIFRLERR